MWIHLRRRILFSGLLVALLSSSLAADDKQPMQGSEFFERHVRPILVQHCYECHSEQENEMQGGLLLDRRANWLKGGDTQAAVVPGNLEASLLIKAVRYEDDDLQMPPGGRLDAELVKRLEQWVRLGAPGPKKDLSESEFSRLGDQGFLFSKAKEHWAYQPVANPTPPTVDDPRWNQQAIDRFIYAAQRAQGLSPSEQAAPSTLLRRLSFDLTGLPPKPDAARQWRQRFAAESVDLDAYAAEVERLLASPAFGEHLGRMWLDVSRYADTDSFYRPDTRTPHYFPFAFTYRDYVVAAFNKDKPFDQFIREQLAADLLDFEPDAPELAALGFLTIGPYANRNQAEALDDWIDVTTRGLMGVTAACARCHDHKYEPIPTSDYYALRGVFNAVIRVKPLDEKNQPLVTGYEQSTADVEDYESKRAAIDAKIQKAAGKKAKGNNRSVAEKIRETELAELLLFHPGAPVHAMVVQERPRAPASFVFLRGDAARRGDPVSRRFLSILDPSQAAFSDPRSGRLELADKIVAAENPLTARVFVNRVWGLLIGSYLVSTPSDFGLQGATPSHPQLLDWLATDFASNGWSVKQLVRRIVMSETYRQAVSRRGNAESLDPQNRLLWRANRKHLPIEAIRDGMLQVSGQLDRTMRGRPAPLWGKEYTKRRSLYGYINRFNLDPTLRVFDFPTPMQSQAERRESIVAPQALFTMNSPFVVEQAAALTKLEAFESCDTDDERVRVLFDLILQRPPAVAEVTRVRRFVELQQRFFETPKANSGLQSPWPLAAQALLMSNEFQYVD